MLENANMLELCEHVKHGIAMCLNVLGICQQQNAIY